MVCLITDALGGSSQASLPRAVAIEMIHAASLIHDDFIDQDAERRSSPATWTILGPRRAILFGDLMFASAIAMMSEMSNEDGLVISRAIAQLAKGAFHEQSDPLLVAEQFKAKPDGSMYEEIIALKTGILFGTACRLGAIAADAGKGLKEGLFQYGMRIGEAYQIADDLMEVAKILLAGSIDPQKLAELIPALLYFNGDEMQRHFMPILAGQHHTLSDTANACLTATQQAMQKEIEKRLNRAVTAIPGGFPNNGYAPLVLRAPRDLVRMLQQS
jgi:hypothetical protein